MGPSPSGASWTYSSMPTGKPALFRFDHAQYAASWKAPSSARGSTVQADRRGLRIQSDGLLVRTQPTIPCGDICSIDSIARIRGPWNVNPP